MLWKFAADARHWSRLNPRPQDGAWLEPGVDFLWLVMYELSKTATITPSRSWYSISRLRGMICCVFGEHVCVNIILNAYVYD